MRSITVILILLILPVIMKSQTATATIDSVSSCSSDTVVVPVQVTDFIDVGAMTIFIGYDTNNAEFISLTNINPVIPGQMTVYANNGQVGIAYSYISGFTITEGLIFDLNYLLLDSTTALTFNPGTEIANTNLQVIPLETYDGGIFNGLTITDQPDSVQAYPDTDVTFTVLATGNNIAYQWEENDGSGWLSLQNNSTYSGVNTDTLTIYDVSLSYDGYLYRCLLSAGDCDQYSDIALLEVNSAYPVATIGLVNSCPEQTVMEPIHVGDFLDVIDFTFNIAFDSAILEFNSLQNIHSDLLSGTLTTSPLGNPNGISIHWENTDPISITSGKLFDMEFDYSFLDATLEFITGTEVYNSFNNLIDITLNNGHVYQYDLPEITMQPVSQTVMQYQPAVFSVEADGVESYQWQLSTDEGQNWSDLQDAIPYYNVTTNELTVDPVTWDLNGFQYACLLFNENCEIRSDAAVLTVDTLTRIGNNTTSSYLPEMRLNPNPAGDMVQLAFNCTSPCKAVIKILSMSGKAMEKIDAGNVSNGTHTLLIDLSDLSAGLYVVELILSGTNDVKLQHSKLIRLLN